ncbi:hypothetical protein FA09DRAFT_137970 [Tilletiopsis washingtonensis]|uniref:Uncharacterized protein n=1 Tax=Tilletiopsis washingtonensis TaxID=58919 RepID=A0A316Z3R3_9BASI|nr:hypothetical protein FA09DRAFT_137970 [Tilletiopsis washingtonensis]PWN95714.1 hypothetical protein FA09DRAFT_137970 [Tilletiopsis washingtonensis]
MKAGCVCLGSKMDVSTLRRYVPAQATAVARDDSALRCSSARKRLAAVRPRCQGGQQPRAAGCERLPSGDRGCVIGLDRHTAPVPGFCAPRGRARERATSRGKREEAVPPP